MNSFYLHFLTAQAPAYAPEDAVEDEKWEEEEGEDEKHEDVEACTLLAVVSGWEPLGIQLEHVVFHVLLEEFQEGEHSHFDELVSHLSLCIFPEDVHRVARCSAGLDLVPFTFLCFVECFD